MWREGQDEFITALRVPELPVPAGIEGSTGRFNVYRNNVALSLRDALADTYPIVKSLVGEEFFNAMAQAFQRRYLPASPVLFEYGAQMATFIEGFSPARSLPYLADVARLEWSWLQAYHAEDADPVGMEQLAAIDDAGLDDIRFETHPSLWLIESQWPVVSIWLAHQQPGTPDLGSLPEGPEYGLVVRPHMDVDVHVISESALRLIDLLADDSALGPALAGLDVIPGADPSADLATLFSAGCVTGIRQ